MYTSKDAYIEWIIGVDKDQIIVKGDTTITFYRHTKWSKKVKFLNFKIYNILESISYSFSYNFFTS